MINDKAKYKIGFSVLVAFMFKILFFPLHEVMGFDLIFIAIATLIISEGNLQIDSWLNSRNTWLKNPTRRILQQSIYFTVFTSCSIFLILFILHQLKFGDGRLINKKMIEIFFPALFFALSILTIFIGFQFFMAWKNSLLDVEKYKIESAEAQLQNLKNQINPHFLFNNLSVLSSLVYKNQDKAVEFIQELSKVYRYVLENKNAELVTLDEELAFLSHYTYLLKIRFENAVSFLITIEDKNRCSYIPPMCLQMLVENAIQHNEASQSKNLHISIYTDNDFLVVVNNIQVRTDYAESSKTGLKNIQSRYSYYTNKKVEISDNGEFFKVTLPLMLK